MNWPQLRKHLQAQTLDRLIEIIKGLYDLNPQNKAYIRNQFGETLEDPIFLEKCRQQVIRAIYPPHRKYPDCPNFAQARKAINAYKKATGDQKGVIDLLLTYAEAGTRFTVDFGDIDAPFYERLETALDNAAETIKVHPLGKQLYAHFRPRFLKLQKKARRMGWGYGDTVNDIVGELEELMAQ